MTREDFLSNVWKRYPVAPKNSALLGRIGEIVGSEANVTVILERNKVTQRQSFRALNLQGAPATSSLTEILTLLRAGDLVAISAEGMITLLAPQLTPLPSRTFDPRVLELWQRYMRFVREFFQARGFIEVATPSLVVCPGTEPTLSPFETEFIRGSRREKLYLPTSPELHLKKALALGAEKIFEVRSCFRNEEVTEIHQPEFTMIEWYRAFAELAEIRKDVEELVSFLVERIPEFKAPKSTEIASVRALFQKHCGNDFRPETSREELKTLASALQVDVTSATTIDDYFFLIFLEKIENSFNPETLNFVENYPPYQAALARVSEEGWGERFEMYFRGLEICNAFHELNDPQIQKARFQQDLEKKRALGKEAVPLESEFMACLEAGMPPASGIALGIDRLFMALSGIQNIAATRVFPLS